MKKLFAFLFIIISLSFQSQIAHYNQYPTMHVDTYVDLSSNASFAYSMRKLRVDYTGPIIQLRRASDNAVRNFYAKNNDIISTSEISTWAGGAALYVSIWYDQSLSNRNATQTATANQPKFNGSNPDQPYFETINTSSQYLRVQNGNIQNVTTGGKKGSLFFVINPTSVNSTIFGTIAGNNRWSAHVNWGNGGAYFDPGSCCSTNRTFLNTSGVGVWNQYSFISGADYIIMRLSNVEMLNGPMATTPCTLTSDFLIGAGSDNANNAYSFATSKITELIMFKTDVSQSFYETIEQNQLAFWPMN